MLASPEPASPELALPGLADPVGAPQMPASDAPLANDRPRARPSVSGKLLSLAGQPFFVRGVTYGTFCPDETGEQFTRPDVIDRDFAAMAAAGANSVRTYTVPPRWVLDTAERHGLKVMVGIPWESHVAFLDEPECVRGIEAVIRDAVRSCAGHSAVLCYSIGNEIPATVVRWLGRRRVEGFLERLYRIAKAEDPEGLVTYASFPTTEYLSLPFLDLCCFNVYLESQERLESYLSRLHNIAGDRPLVMSELGVESRGNGEDAQARILDWQVRTSFAAGCAGTFVFSWTDEWWRGGHEIEEWDFGLTDRKRHPKPALASVRRAFREVPFPKSVVWPRISVVVCTFNGSRTLRDCLDGLAELRYPNYEVVVVDDGSRDDSAAIAASYADVRVISIPNSGLSAARNVGLHAANADIVAYTDDDARPDPHWLTYLAATFLRTDYVALGGPNIPPAGDGAIAECVANSPGGPIHVLLDDTTAEHIPGCNMAFRRDALLEIGGFDEQFRTAGDDVDVCWRLQEQGWQIGFVPAAFVWHHRRNSVRTYWRQQKGYGKAEALLERKWPAKYNLAGHVSWMGRLYGHRLTDAKLRRSGRVNHGTWGTALFQSLYLPQRGFLWSVPAMPEWHFVVLALACVAALGAYWTPLLAALPLALIAAGIPVAGAIMAAGEAVFPGNPTRRRNEMPRRALTALLHLMQPLARLAGRLRYGLNFWRLGGGRGWAMPTARTEMVWVERWASVEDRLVLIERTLMSHRVTVRRGGPSDAWDLSVRGGLLGGAHVLLCIEEHGEGKQFLRFRTWPRFSRAGLAGIVWFAGLAAASSLSGGHPTVAYVLGGVAAVVLFRMLQEAGGATKSLRDAVAHAGKVWTFTEPLRARSRTTPLRASLTTPADRPV